MDMEKFDALSRRLAGGLTRRGATALAVLAMPVLARARDLVAVEAKKKRKKKKRKKKRRPAPPPPLCGGACPGDFPQCCPATTQDPHGFCTAANDVCCTSAEGGGACPESLPKCCPPTAQFEHGLCGDLDDTCCPSDKGGYLCAPGFDCCATSDDCPQDATCEQNCCLPNGATQTRRTARNHDVRRHGG